MTTKEITFIIKTRVSVSSPFVDYSEANNEKLLCCMENLALGDGYEVVDSEIVEVNDVP